MIIAYWLEFHHSSSKHPKLRIEPANNKTAMLFKTTVAFALDHSTTPPTIVFGSANLNKFRFYGYASVLPKLVIDLYGDIVQTIDRKIVMKGTSPIQPFQKTIIESLNNLSLDEFLTQNLPGTLRSIFANADKASVGKLMQS